MSRDNARYVKVAEILQEEIASLSPNVLLPSEHQLAKRFEVSRVTVRRALGLLERSGLVTRYPGRGTLVSPPKITRRLSPVISFEEDLRDQGIKFETQVSRYEPRSTPPPFIRERLHLPRGKSIGLLSLVRLVDGRVVGHDRHYFPPRIAAKFNPSMVIDGCVPEVLRGLAGMPIATVDWETEIVPADREVAAALGITPGVLIAVNTGTEYLEDGEPIQVNIMAYRIDRVRFKFSMRYGLTGKDR